MANTKQIIKKEKNSFVLPKGATVINKTVNIEVEEIENGFLIIKRVELKYKRSDKDYSDYEYINKKYFSETNPFEEVVTQNKELANIFDDNDA